MWGLVYAVDVVAVLCFFPSKSECGENTKYTVSLSEIMKVTLLLG